MPLTTTATGGSVWVVATAHLIVYLYRTIGIVSMVIVVINSKYDDAMFEVMVAQVKVG